MNIEQQFLAQLGPDYAKESKTIAYFFDHAVRDDIASKREGRPVYIDHVYLSKRSALSQSKDEFHRRATEEDRHDFPKEWARYEMVKNHLSKPRVKMLPGLPKSVEMELEELSIRTLAELAACNVGRYSKWRDMAQRILAALESKEAPKPALKAVGTGADFHIEMTL